MRTCESVSSVEPNSLLVRRAPRATPFNLPSVLDRKLTRRSASPSGKLRSTIASDSLCGIYLSARRPARKLKTLHSLRDKLFYHSAGGDANKNRRSTKNNS